MAQQDRSTLESYFETGDVPTQAQFSELIESVPNIIDDGVLLGAEDSMTAFAGGGQANGTPVTKRNSRFTTVATINDSGTMITAVPGMIASIWNDGANTVSIYPASGEQIDSLGTDNPFNIGAGLQATIHCLASGQWYSS